MILITRPQNEAKLLKKILDDMKLVSIIDPVISFEFNQRIFLPSEKSIYLVASYQAVLGLEKKRNKKEIFKRCRFHVIGNKAKDRILRNNGVVLKVFNNSDQYRKFLTTQKKLKHIKIVYLCSNAYNKELVKILDNIFKNVQKRYIYKVIKSKRLKNITIKSFSNKKINKVLLFSSYSANVFCSLMRAHALKEDMLKIDYYCMSKNIAKVLKSHCIKNITVAKKPDLSSFIKLLDH